MACFTVSAVEAIVVKVIEKNVAKKEDASKTTAAIPMSKKLSWLSGMLFGGSALLAFEHVWHGEITPWFPFLTAMSNAEDMAEMFKEIATVGVCMAVLITVVWLGVCIIADKLAASAVRTAKERG